MMRAALLTGMALASALAGCNPPPSDAPVARVSLANGASGPSEPLPSPDTKDAIWAQSVQANRLVYGVPGQPVLVSLECSGPAPPAAQLVITRNAPADKGAGALLALIGNRMIARVAVDATELGGKRVWQGKAPAAMAQWDALADPVDATVTVPGAGLVRLNASPLPGELVKACRGVPEPPVPPQLVPVPNVPPTFSPVP
ncbi:MAG: hypothetical protein C0471_11805 [Erythrobacter sp.]|nr:hypothetical protein [Erythrobacter sp.]